MNKSNESNGDTNRHTLPPDEKILVEDGTETQKRFSPLLRQVLATSGPIIATISAGTTAGYSAILLPQLYKENSLIKITDNEATWIGTYFPILLWQIFKISFVTAAVFVIIPIIASIPAITMALGCLLGGIIMQRFGRKTAHFILNVPFVVGWVLLSMSQNLFFLLIGRIITGLCVGLLGPPAPVYIAETSSPKYRAFLASFVTLAVSSGILIVHALGTFLTWQMTAVVCGIFPFISYLLMTFVPESPSWLLSTGQLDEAANAFKWLRGHDIETYKEFQMMVDAQQKLKDANNSDMDKQTVMDKIVSNAFYKPIVILFVYFGTMQLSGMNAIIFYSVEILQKTLGENINEYVATISIDVVRVIISFLACFLIRKSGRRPLMAVTGFGTAFSLILLALYLHWSKKDPQLNSYPWIPLTLLVLYITCVSSGLNPLPWCMTGEMFPLRFRALGSAFVTCFNFSCFFIVLKTKSALFEYFQSEGAYAIYGVLAFIGTVILCIYLPETKNKSLQEIEDYYNGNKTENDKRSTIDTHL